MSRVGFTGDMTDAVRLGNRFRAVRRRLGLRQADVAQRAGVSSAIVSRIERGQIASLTLARAARVAEVLEIWLRDPSRPIAALSFLPLAGNKTVSRDLRAPRRVRRL
jgi:transcriptional regulator with XRE-family HTH domain